MNKDEIAALVVDAAAFAFPHQLWGQSRVDDGVFRIKHGIGEDCRIFRIRVEEEKQ